MPTSSTHHRFHVWSVMLTLMVYPFSVTFTNLTVLLLFAHWLVWLGRFPGDFNFDTKSIVIFILPILVTLASFTYSGSNDRWLDSLDTRFPLLLLPLIFGSAPRLDRKTVNAIFAAAVLSTLVALGYCVVYALLRRPFTFDNLFWSHLTSPIGFHPTYLSIYVNCQIAWLFLHLIDPESRPTPRLRTMLIVGICLLLVFILLLVSKIQQACTIVIVAFFCLRTLSRPWLIGLGATAIIVGASVFGIARKTYLWERYLHISTVEYKLDGDIENFNELTQRFALAECSWYAVRNHLAFGVGAGNQEQALNAVYKEVGYKPGYHANQNPHNQFLSVLVSTGMVGLVIFVFSVAYQLSVSWKEKRILLIVFLALLLVNFFFESILERHKGVVLYAAITNLLFFYTNNNAHSKTRLS